MTGEDKSFDYDRYYAKSRDKARRLIEAGCTFSDFGTRRRASFEAQDTAIRAMKECQETLAGPGRFIGTSNVYFAMKYDLVPVGTMAHELICAIVGMFGPQMANYLAMRTWAGTYRGALGTFLYDTYGWRIFSLNFSTRQANKSYSATGSTSTRLSKYSITHKASAYRRSVSAHILPTISTV